MTDSVAPCVAVVGPANSGKTTLLHLLDDALQGHAAQPLVYVVKGSPDGTGRYLFHAPHLRESLKSRVKGAWSGTTVATVCRWIYTCRRHLDLVLVDLGGRHAPGNDAIFQRCTHFLAVARCFEDPEQERREGLDSWVEACERSGLKPLACLQSVLRGEPSLARRSERLEGVFRGDSCSPGDTTNSAVVTGLVEALLGLVPRSSSAPYLDLRLGRDWCHPDLVTLGGLRSRVVERVGDGSPLVLGGRAPIWAYAAALHRALDADSRAAVAVFDPKVPAGLVPVPETLAEIAEPSLAEQIQAQWRPMGDREGTFLDLRITTPDRFLSLENPDDLRGVPLPQGEPPRGPLIAYGAGPIWLHLAYSRWLRSLPGERSIGLWDARTEATALLTGPDAPRFVPELPEGAAS